MSRFALLYPYFIIVCCLIIGIIGISSIARMPVDLLPEVKIPTVVVLTFYSGMPAEQIESTITSPIERFLTLSSGIRFIESKSLQGVSLIKVTFQPGTDPDSAASVISNFAMASLRTLPVGTLPPIVMKFDTANLPVCLITLRAEGLNESQLRDIGQFVIRDQLASIPGASVPVPFGGRLRQIMVYVDPLKLEATQLSVMDVVRTMNDSNLILPVGDVKIGPFDYNIFANNQLDTVEEINAAPLKTIGNSSVTVGDIGYAEDGNQIQYNIVRVNGQNSIYMPILRQGGDSNTIAIVDGVKDTVANLLDVPEQLITKVVFDQSIFIKEAIKTLLHEGAIGLSLTALMILIFLGSVRATLGVFFSIPVSVMTAFIVLSLGGYSINSMILGGITLAFSRLIDDSVVVMENIFRHIESGEDPKVAAELGGREVAMPVLAATLTASIVFFPVTLMSDVSHYLFTPLAFAVVIALLASYVTAMTVVPLFCAKFIRNRKVGTTNNLWMQKFNNWFNAKFATLLDYYDYLAAKVLRRPKLTLLIFFSFFILSLTITSLLGYSYFPRTDPGQFVINIKAPSGTRLEETEKEVAKVEDIIRRIVPENEREVIISNIGVTTSLSALYTSNNASHTAFTQVSLTENHSTGSYEYMDRIRAALTEEMPELTTFFQTGGLMDAILNMGMPAPINIQISSMNIQQNYYIATQLAQKIRELDGVSDVFIPQDIDTPAFMLDINRIHASELGLSPKEIIDNVTTAVVSNQMFNPSYWNDPVSGNPYLFTVQYPEDTIQTIADLKAIPIRGFQHKASTRLDNLVNIETIQSPSIVSHFQIRRVVDIYVATKAEDLSRTAKAIDRIISNYDKGKDVTINVHGAIIAMYDSFQSFFLGLLLSILLVYLVLVAQFKSFIDPFIIILAVPPGIIGVLFALLITNTTLNIMSLMGIIMLVGISVSNSILIVEFTHRLIDQGTSLIESVSKACRIRLRPILMTSLATIIGLIPMALAIGAGSEAYASLARVIIGGLIFSVLITIFIVPSAYLLVYRSKNTELQQVDPVAGGVQ